MTDRTKLQHQPWLWRRNARPIYGSLYSVFLADRPQLKTFYQTVKFLSLLGYNSWQNL